MQRPLSVVIASICLALTAAACHGKSGAVLFGSTPSATASVTATNDLSGAHFKSGTAHVEVTGELTSTFEMNIRAQTTQWNAQGMSLFFQDSKGDAIGLGGTSIAGRRKTSGLMTFTFTDVQAGYVLGISTRGECSVDVTRSDTNGVDAKVDCERWKVENKTLLNIKATVSVRP